MKTIMIYFILALSIGGCISAPDTPNPRFYMLQRDDSGAKKYEIDAGIIIEVGPVKIPRYQDRPQIVTQDKNRMLKFAQFDRWGEPLDIGLSRLIAENLALMLPGASFQTFPSNFAIPLTYQVIVDVVKLESQLDGNLDFAAQWSVIVSEHRKMLITKRFELSLPVGPHTYEGLVKALSKASSLLSSDIAETLALRLEQRKAEQ